VPKGPSKEDLAATKIQARVRGFLAKKRLAKTREEKQKYEDDIAELEKQAYIQIVERERAEEEKRQEKERVKRQKEARRRKRQKVMLEAAFDDELEDIQKLIKEAISELDDRSEACIQKETRILVEARDANDNSPLGEASAGGANEVIAFLVKNNGNCNHKGQWGRTPLYRATFAGHKDTALLLLESGADPRIAANDSNTPKDAAGNKELVALFEDWDISKTEELAKKYEENMNGYKNLQRLEMAKAVGGIEEQVAEKKKIFETVRKELKTAYCEFEKRVVEHDKAVAEGFDKPELTIASIHDAELHLETTKVKMEKAQLELSQIQLKLREQQHMQRNMEAGEDGEEFEGVDEMSALVSRCNIKELTDVLFKDVGNKIRDSGKWPLLMDSTGQATLFLRYRDTNMVNILDTRACELNRLRESLLGSIRYGKPLIVDLGAMDLWEAMEAGFDRIKEGLFSSLLSKALMDNQGYMELVTKDDKEEYQPTKFVHHMAKDFRFVVLTKMSCPPMEWIENCYAVEVIVTKRD